MQQRLHLFLILSLALFGCSQTNEASHPWQEITGRDHLPVYRARVPSYWQRHEITAPLHDTMLPLCEFTIDSLKIAIHNFPADTLEERIPPIAQVTRWKRQLALTEPTDSVTSPVGHGGFTGMHLSGNGIMAWSMQLAVPHFRNLQLAGTSEERSYFRQMRADYTIKVTGPQEALDRHRNDLIAFADSFELIQEVPSQL